MRHVNRSSVGRKISVLDSGIRDSRSFRPTGPVSQSFVNREEKQFVPLDLPARAGAELVPLERRFGSAGETIDVVEVVFSIQCVVAEKIGRCTVKLVRYPPRHPIYLRGAAPEFGGVWNGLDL